VLFDYVPRRELSKGAISKPTRTTAMTTANSIEPLIKLAFLLLLAIIVTRFIGAEVSTVAQKIAANLAQP